MGLNPLLVFNVLGSSNESNAEKYDALLFTKAVDVNLLSSTSHWPCESVDMQCAISLILEVCFFKGITVLHPWIVNSAITAADNLYFIFTLSPFDYIIKNMTLSL